VTRGRRRRDRRPGPRAGAAPGRGGVQAGGAALSAVSSSHASPAATAQDTPSGRVTMIVQAPVSNVGLNCTRGATSPRDVVCFDLGQFCERRATQMRYILMIAACALTMHSAVAQDLKSIEVVFEVTRSPDGSLIFIEKNQNEDVKVFSYDENFAATLEQMKGPPTTGWAVSDASGRVKDVLLAGDNQNVPPELLAKIGVGESVTKVNIASFGGVSFPTEEEIDEMFRQSIATVIDRMCVLPSNRRPADMTTSFTVGVSMVMQASLLVAARWEAANVCQ